MGWSLRGLRRGDGLRVERRLCVCRIDFDNGSFLDFEVCRQLDTDVASVAARGRIGQVKSEEMRGWAREERRNDICSTVNAFRVGYSVGSRVRVRVEGKRKKSRPPTLVAAKHESDKYPFLLCI